MSTKTKRQQMREQNRRQAIRSKLIWGGIGLAVLTILGFVVWQAIRPSAGEAVAVMSNSSTHIETDSDPGKYNSDPPTSGPHYPQEAEAGFYDTNNYAFPAGYLVHNLEHGYVIFWYNCDLLEEAGCADLKTQIQTVMDDLGGAKMIAYPWPSLEVPFAMTSWGRIQKFDSFNVEQAKAFYRTNLNRAPEPNAP